MKRFRQTLGFLPREALLSYLDKGWVFGATADEHQLVGYLLYAAYRDYFRITQLCVSDEHRGQGIAKELLNTLKESATTQKVIRLSCRRDFPAHDMWPRLGFIPIHEKRGRSQDGHPLTLWCLTLAQGDQLELFRARTDDDALDVVVDAQIFFDFYEPTSHSPETSKTLRSDFLSDSLRLWITDELLVEIDRKRDPGQRQRSRQRAQSFPTVFYDPQSAEHFEESLREILPSHTPNQRSDIRHLAKSAASDVHYFVTRDHRLLQHAEEVARQTGLQVLSPAALIVQHHELTDREAYAADRISGIDLNWRRMSSDDFASLQYQSFLEPGEKHRAFRDRIASFLANPRRYDCQILWLTGQPAAIRVLEPLDDHTLIVHFGRVALSHARPLFETFLVTDTVQKAVRDNIKLIKLRRDAVPTRAQKALLNIGFTSCNDDFVRFCLPEYTNRDDVLANISQLFPDVSYGIHHTSDRDLEELCSPLALTAADQKYFLIPIRPNFAMSLFDQRQAANDLFGGDTKVLLRWDNVYYRHKTHHKVLTPPARLLWYVSQDHHEIVAISRLDAVEVDTPKALFRKYKRFGVLEWKEIYELCHRDPSREIMAMRFSHTFLLRKPVPLSSMRDIFEKCQVGLTLQSPLSIPSKVFQELFKLGYPSDHER